MKEHPVFARFWDAISSLGGRKVREHRRQVASGGHGRVLEIGSGTGLNFEFVPAGSELVALEPEPNMVRRSVERAASARARVRLVRATAEALPFRDGSFDSAIVTLSFCTIPDPDRAASEVHRVLKPGGALHFYEHVRSPSERAARWQDRLERPWGVVGAGCHPNRDTVATLRHAGFEVEFRPVRVGPPSPVRPQVVGTARRP